MPRDFNHSMKGSSDVPALSKALRAAPPPGTCSLEEQVGFPDGRSVDQE
jgi:hypothetical protein